MSRSARLAGLGLLSAVLAGSPQRASAAPIPNDATRNMLDTHPGMRAMIEGRGLAALYGPTIANSDEYPEAADTDGFVDAFITDPSKANALGVTGAVLERVESIDIKDGKVRVYTCVQKIEGLPVHGSIVTIPVLLGSENPHVPDKIRYIGMQLSELPPAQIS